jgi:hypothetical protein
MAKGTPARAAQVPQRSSDAMILVIPTAMWELLVEQAQFEGRRPGDVLDDAVSSYLKARGGDGVRVAIGGRR